MNEIWRLLDQVDIFEYHNTQEQETARSAPLNDRDARRRLNRCEIGILFLLLFKISYKTASPIQIYGERIAGGCY